MEDKELEYLLDEFDLEQFIWVKDYPSPFMIVLPGCRAIYAEDLEKERFFIATGYWLKKYEVIQIDVKER